MLESVLVTFAVSHVTSSDKSGDNILIILVTLCISGIIIIMSLKNTMRQADKQTCTIVNDITDTTQTGPLHNHSG